MLALEVLLCCSSHGFYRVAPRTVGAAARRWRYLVPIFPRQQRLEAVDVVGPFEGLISEDRVSRHDPRRGANEVVMPSLVRFLVVAGDHQYLAYLW